MGTSPTSRGEFFGGRKRKRSRSTFGVGDGLVKTPKLAKNLPQVGWLSEVFSIKIKNTLAIKTLDLPPTLTKVVQVKVLGFVSLKKLAQKFSVIFFMSSNRGDEVILDASWGAFRGGKVGSIRVAGAKPTPRSFRSDMLGCLGDEILPSYVGSIRFFATIRIIWIIWVLSWG